MKAKRTWVIVADSQAARVLERKGPGRELVEIPGAVFEAPRSHGRDLFSDRAGRTFDSVGGGRHANEPSTSAEEQGRARFIKAVAGWVDEPKHAGAFDRLALVAPAKTLGALRKELSLSSRAKVVCECDKDLTKASSKEILEALNKQTLL